LQIRALWHHTTVRAGGVQDVTTRATRRPQRTKAKSVYHVRGLRDGDAPTSLIKIQGIDTFTVAELFPLGEPCGLLADMRMAVQHRIERLGEPLARGVA
jgi:hypothetical protein